MRLSLVGEVTDQLNPITTQGKISSTDLPQTLLGNALSNIVFPLVGIGAVVSLIYGGILYITAGADTEKAETGKRVIMYSIIAIVIVLLSYLVYSAIGPAIESGSL